MLARVMYGWWDGDIVTCDACRRTTRLPVWVIAFDPLDELHMGRPLCPRCFKLRA